MNDNETIADVIAAMRDEAARADMEQECSIDDAASAAKMMREFARRFEAAHKREMRDAVTNCNQFGNAAKLREALSDACYAMFNFLKAQNGGYEEMASALDKAKAALAAPPRNCDVGSVAEQKERFKDFCKEGKLSRIDLGAYCAYDCPCRDSYDCELAWAQMPYEEGVPNAE